MTFDFEYLIFRFVLNILIQNKINYICFLATTVIYQKCKYAMIGTPPLYNEDFVGVAPYYGIEALWRLP